MKYSRRRWEGADGGAGRGGGPGGGGGAARPRAPGARGQQARRRPPKPTNGANLLSTGSDCIKQHCRGSIILRLDLP